MVPSPGLEPGSQWRRILSPMCLPISPRGRNQFETIGPTALQIDS